MMHTKSLMVLAGAALGLSSVAMAQQTSEDLRASERELQSDASARSSFQGDSGPTLDLSGYTQFQFNLNVRDDSDENAALPGGTGTSDLTDANRSDSLTTGFRFAKTKLVAKGNITQEWSYKLQGRFATDGGGFALEDMYGQYTMDNGWNFQVGEKKLPFLKEELVADTGQQASQRGIFNDEFTVGRAEGVFLNYAADSFRFMGAFSDGAGTQNTEFTSGTEADYAFTARGEWKWAGEFSRFDQYSSWNGNENAGMVGGAAHYQDGGSTVGTSDTAVFGATIDAIMQGSGWNVAGAAVYQMISPAVGDDVSDIGLQVQGGFFVTDDWEFFGRGNYILPDDNAPERDDFYTITAGANWFITPQSQNAKLTLEVIYAGEATTIVSGDNSGAQNVSTSANSGVLPDAEGGQFNVRAQLQLMF